MNCKRLLYGITFIACIVLSFYMGKWNEASINKKPSGIKFDEVEEMITGSVPLITYQDK